MELSLDPSKTAPFELGPSTGSPCLLLHGFTGSPWEVRPLGEALAQAGHPTCGIRLPGHGENASAMLAATAEDWLTAAERGLLAQSGPTHVLGLSMGAILAVWLAGRYPEKVRSLVLMAPAVEFHSKPMAFAKLLRATPIMDWLSPWITKGDTDLQDPQARAEAPVLDRFPSRALRALWKVQEESRAQWNNVKAPALIVFARQDHVVRSQGARVLAQGLVHAQVQVSELKQGFHIMPRDTGRAELTAQVLNFVRSH